MTKSGALVKRDAKSHERKKLVSATTKSHNGSLPAKIIAAGIFTIRVPTGMCITPLRMLRHARAKST